ncbi:MAG: T9SS type A sorting domain-containing protein [Bacteroidales bacterium]|nr:T9SS type A sorting domain-containing protein [Bacteroidales bacterium]
MKKISVTMKNMSRLLFAALFVFLIVDQGWARERQLPNGKTISQGLKQTTAGCSPSSAFEWLDINNVRARINAGGDMWWDLVGGTGAKYFIPKSGSATSLFAGSLWIGGLDINNQLKLAAVRFRQDGNDFWTGPLTIDGTAAIDEVTCAEYDRHFKMTRAMVDEFLANTDPVTGAFIPNDDYSIPTAILEWPAHGDVSKNQSFYLAPFYDVDGDGEYNPLLGDYPYYDIDNSLCHTKTPTLDEAIEGSIYGSILADQVIKGDQTLWWVFNDKGNIHTESQGAAIGLEIRAQAFAFATNDEVNNMTFYSYEIINRSTFELTETYFSPWVDTDLGYAFDDFVGCDVGRGLGYCYNGKAVDGSGDPESYGDQPPAIGIDFFQGPYLDPDGNDNPKYRLIIDPSTGDTIGREQLCDVSINGVNFGNGIPDDERFGMRRFVYHNNCASGPTCDPNNAPETYNLLRGIWKDNIKMQYGGTAHPSGSGTVGPDTDFMFPGDTDPCNWGTGQVPPNGGYTQNGLYWTEETGNNGSPNDPGDRRFMQSAGPFTLKPGAVNYITFGVPWARAVSGGPFASVQLLRRVDDKAQALFDNCFKVIDGPNAPDLSFQELDRELIVYISNSPSSNNYGESYFEIDPNILQPHPNDPNKRSDSLYRFEGYQIFQLKDPTVSVESLHDPNKVRLVGQFDKKNGVSKLVNFRYDELIEANVPILEVVGADDGIKHSFNITQDAFATGDNRLVNHKQYYFLAISYAYNEYMKYSQEPAILNGLLGQKSPYLAGRKNIKTYTAIPHKTINGIVVNGNYGDGPEIIRLSGNGNGGNVLELKQETIDEIMSKEPASETNLYGGPDYPIAYNPVYHENYGPISVKVVDPLNVVSADYQLAFDTLKYIKLYNVTGEAEIRGDTASKMVSNWKLIDLGTGETYLSDTTTLEANEQLFLDRGIAITIEQPFNTGPYRVGQNSDNKPMFRVLAHNNGFLESSIIYADSSRRWLDGIRDEDVPGYALNWIRSGTNKDQENPSNDDWQMSTDPDRPWDPDEAYEKILNGTWAPYSLTTFANNIGQGSTQSIVGPAFSEDSKSFNRIEEIASVDIVLTPDKSKWTRSPVLEMSYDRALAEGNAVRFGLRQAPSVDKDGNSAASMDMEGSNNPNDPNYIASYGMGWFPGYAINIETGERLNIMFGEDSYLSAQNGRDMLFNPTAKDMDLNDQLLDPNIFSQVGFRPLMGGKHYVYVMRHDYYNFTQLNIEFESPAYDAGRYAHGVLDTLFNTQFPFVTNYFFTQIMYVGMPMAVKGEEWLSNEARIRIRVAKPYERNYSKRPLDTIYAGMDVNRFYPSYQFSTESIATSYDVPSKIQQDLDIVGVVPNPYYAYSSYERNALDNRVKITNLPERCVITIYNMSGTKIRQFKKDEPKTSIDWDLKNFAGVPIASGVYLIHIKSDDGERIIKWFGTMRPIDLNTF